MSKRTLWSAAFVVATSAFVVPCFAKAPVEIAKVAPVADLVMEAEGKVKALEAALETNETYTAAKNKTIPAEAGVLAVLAQAIAEDTDKAAWKASAPDLRDAAITVAGSKSYDEAKAGLAKVKDALGGKAGGAKAEHEWNKLAKFGSVMEEVNKRTGKLRRATRKLPDDTAEASRDASVLAVIALVVHADTHEVKKKEDTPKWQALASEMQVEMTKMAAALKAKDAAGSKDAFTKANKACSECHEKFRD